MANGSKLSMALISQALTAASVRYEIDKDGDVHFIVSRRKGKDLDFYIWHTAAEKDILALSCWVTRWFKQDEFASALLFCNTWNRKSRLPKAYLTEPDSDGDHRVMLEHTVLCEGGVSVELISNTVQFFMFASGDFWNELDDEI